MGLEGHGKGVFTKFFKILIQKQVSTIRPVSGGGDKESAECISEFCPDSQRYLYPFHVVQ